MNSKKNILIVVIFLIVIAIMCWLLLKNKSVNMISNTGNNRENQSVQKSLITEAQDGTKVNVSEHIKDAKYNVDGLEITNIKLSELAGMTELSADVKNMTNEAKGDVMLDITLLDRNNTEMIKMVGYIGTVRPNGTATLNVSAPLDYCEAYSIKIEKK